MSTENKIVIARSVARKLNLANYGGKAYEMVDFFASYSQEFPADTPVKELKQQSDRLYALAEADVGENIKAMREELLDNK